MLSRLSVRRFLVPVTGLAVLLAAMGPGALAVDADQSVTMSATEFAFAPNNISVTPGQTVHITVTNDGKFPHSLTIQGGGVNASLPDNLAPGQSGTLDVTFTQPGSISFWCPIPGHRERGMEGTIQVAGASAVAQPAQLPNTGSAVDPGLVGAGAAAAGALLIGGGWLARRRLAAAEEPD